MKKLLAGVLAATLIAACFTGCGNTDPNAANGENNSSGENVVNVFNWGDPVIGVHRTYSSANIVKGVPFSNTQQYRNPKVDAIMEQAASEVDNEKRAKLYKEFQQIVMNDVPIYFMTTTAYHTIYNKRVGNVPASIWGFLAPYMDVYLKK